MVAIKGTFDTRRRMSTESTNQNAITSHTDLIQIETSGKGEMQTCWLEIKSGCYSVASTAHDDSSTQWAREDELLDISSDMNGGPKLNKFTSKLDRLVNWNVEILSNLIKHIVARRRKKGLPDSGEHFDAKVALTHGGTVLDEVQEIIALPDFDETGYSGDNHESIRLSENVMHQLHEYVRCIAMLYRDNPFHNFEHASHVVLSSVKLLGRIVVPTDIEYNVNCERRLASTLHHHTYGITSDPLTQFSCCYCALIHDAGTFERNDERRMTTFFSATLSSSHSLFLKIHLPMIILESPILSLARKIQDLLHGTVARVLPNRTRSIWPGNCLWTIDLRNFVLPFVPLLKNFSGSVNWWSIP